MNHPFNWLKGGRLAIEARLSVHPAIQDCSGRIAERLAALLLQRLPPDLARPMLQLLPETENLPWGALRASADCESDSSIGYPTFVELTSAALGTDQSEENLRIIADAFLWGVTQEIPSEFKTRLSEALPLELQSRMGLNPARREERRVA